MSISYDNIGGVWHKTNKIYDNIGGAWHQTKKAYDNINGVWRNSFNSAISYIGSDRGDQSASQDYIWNFSEPLPIKITDGFGVVFSIGQSSRFRLRVTAYIGLVNSQYNSLTWSSEDKSSEQADMWYPFSRTDDYNHVLTTDAYMTYFEAKGCYIDYARSGRLFAYLNINGKQYSMERNASGEIEI